MEGGIIQNYASNVTKEYLEIRCRAGNFHGKKMKQ
jgi:hypothetical protein